MKFNASAVRWTKKINMRRNALKSERGKELIVLHSVYTVSTCFHYVVPSFQGLDGACYFILFDLLDKSNMSVMIAL